MIILKLISGGVQSFFAPCLLVVQLFNLVLNCVVSELSKEHLLLLVNELVDVLGALLAGELDAGLGNVHGGADDTAINFVVVVKFL